MTTKSLARLLAVSAAAVLALTACSANSSSGASTSSGSTSSGGSDSLNGAKVAFLMPDEASTRYEQHDRPGYEKKIKELCASCQVLYNNADGDAAKQQQQFTTALTQGAKVIVLDPVDSAAAAGLVQNAKSQGVKVIAYDRPIPTTPADFYCPAPEKRSISDRMVYAENRPPEGGAGIDRPGARTARAMGAAGEVDAVAGAALADCAGVRVRG